MPTIVSVQTKPWFVTTDTRRCDFSAAQLRFTESRAAQRLFWHRHAAPTPLLRAIADDEPRATFTHQR
jgi:hypothetical protein